MVPLSIFSWFWLVMKAVNPITKKLQYFVDKCLPFGASISCAIFQRFSNALKHIVLYKTKELQTKRALTNYLDDFLFIAATAIVCNDLIQQFLDVCSDLGVPIAFEKTEWASTQLIFLGMLLDGKLMIIAIPEDKRARAVYLLKIMKDKKKATVKQLQALCGYLSFLNKAIYPGRAFTWRMYSKYSQITNRKFNSKSTKPQVKRLKQHHHVRLDKEFKSDCMVCLNFLTDKNLKRIVCRPMINLNVFTTSKQINFYSDASAANELGYGCVFQNYWLYGKWESNFIRDYKPSIEFLELYALCAGVLTWEKLLTDCQIIIFCDNQAVVSMINNLTSSCKRCMYLIRILVLNGLIYNRRVAVKYVCSRTTNCQTHSLDKKYQYLKN